VKALVTGASGLTGRALAQRLLAEGVAVTAAVRTPAACADLAARGADVVAADLRDREALFAAARGADVVYHVAALYRSAGVPDRAYREVNVDGTRHLLEAAAAGGATRFVHCSTIGVHGSVEHPPADETAPFKPGDLYQETKLEAELMALAFGRERGLPVSVVRPAGIYGPGDTRFLKLFRMIQQGRYVYLGDGTPYLHLVYIDDLVDGFLLAGSRPEAVGEAFIIAGERYVSHTELYALIAAALGVRPPRLHLPVWPVRALGALVERVCIPLGIEPPLHRRRVDFFVKSRAFSIAKARRLLGYAPQVDLPAGIDRTIAWYRANRLLAQE
jgi:nucleoside-diphosphate-sugar epimerase